MDVSRTQRTLLRVCWCAAAILIAVLAIQFGTGVGGDWLTSFLQDYLYNALLFAGAGFCLWRAVAIRQERLAWLVLGCGLVSWTAADIVWTAVYADDPNAPYRASPTRSGWPGTPPAT
jgi:hypothetical protein